VVRRRVRGFVNISSAIRNLGSEISRFREGLKVLKLKGFNLKMELKLKCLKSIPEGGVPESRVVCKWKE
jgi:hypothetical protein